MISNLNEDDALILLNNINITDDDFCDGKLTDIEERILTKDIMSKVKPKSPKRRKLAIAAAITFIAAVSIPITHGDVLAKVLSKLAIIPGIGEVTITDKNLSLTNSITSNYITLNSLIITSNKIAAIVTTNNSSINIDTKLILKDENGNTYELTQLLEIGSEGKPSAARFEYSGTVKNGSNYTLKLMNPNAAFTLKSSDFTEVKESEILYSSTNGKSTLNITSVKRKDNILIVDYFVTDTLIHDYTRLSFNFGTFEEEKEDKERGLEPHESNIYFPYFILKDEYGNTEYGHCALSTITYQNQSLFDLNKLKGNKLKLTLPSINYTTRNNVASKDFSITLDVPKKGKALLDKTGEYNGIKFKITSIERLSDKEVSLQCSSIQDNNSKIQPVSIFLENYGCGGGSSSAEGNTNITLTSKKTIGNQLELNSISYEYASVGPFEFELDLNEIK